jgi:hypothetical protein
VDNPDSAGCANDVTKSYYFVYLQMNGECSRTIHLFSSLTWWPINAVGRPLSILSKLHRRPTMQKVLRIIPERRTGNPLQSAFYAHYDPPTELLDTIFKIHY